MVLQSWTPTKEKKGAVSYVGTTPTPSTLRRVPVKPLGEHNRSRSHSPAVSGKKDVMKRTTANQKSVLAGVDLTRRFADSVHGGAATSSRGADFRSPRGSPSLDRIQEGCSSSMGRERKVGSGTAWSKSRLRGSGDTPPVKKAITFSTPFGKEKLSSVKITKPEKLLPRRKDLSEHFMLDGKKREMEKEKEEALGLMGSSALTLSRHGGREVDMVESLGLTFSDMPTTMGSRAGLRGKVKNEKLTHQRSFGARDHERPAFVEDAPCRLAFDAIDVSPQLEALQSGVEGWDDDERLGGGSPAREDECDLADVVLLPLPCNSPEVCARGSTSAGEGALPWDELQEDNVAQEWFRSRDMACFESFKKGSKTPEPQSSKSPELSRRAIGVGALLEGAGVDERQEEVVNQQTPSPQPTSSPEFLKRGSIPPSTGGCFGAGPLMGPEGMRSVKDRRKCKPRGILTIEGEFLISSGSDDFVTEDVQVKETISVPALASVEWMVAEGCDGDPPPLDDDPPSCSPNAATPDMDASRKLVSPGSVIQLREIGTGAGHRRCKSAVESGSDQIFWKKGLLYEWNLSLSDQKRTESRSPSANEEEVSHRSPVGKLRGFSPEITPGPSRLSNIMGCSLVMGALGSLTNTPSSCRGGASDVAGEEEVQSKYVPSDTIQTGTHRNDGNLDDVKGSLLLVEKTLQELSLDGQAPRLSMSFSLDSSPESGGSWQGIHTSQSTAWGDSQGDDSQGEWGDYLRNNNRYKGFSSQFRFHSNREEYTPAAKADTRAHSREVVSTSTPSVGYSDEGDSVVCTPSSTATTNFKTSQLNTPCQDSWKKYCPIGENPAKGVGMVQDPEQISGDVSPDLVGISISISEAPSLDSSNDDFEILRYHHSQVHPTLVERGEEETKAPRGRARLHEADYSPSSLLKADASLRASVSVQPRGC